MTKLNQAPNAKLSVEVVRLSRPAGTVCLSATGQRLTAAAWWLLHSNLSRLEALCCWVVRPTVHLPILVTSLKKFWGSFLSSSTLTCCSEVVRGQRSEVELTVRHLLLIWECRHYFMAAHRLCWLQSFELLDSFPQHLLKPCSSSQTL